VGLRLPTEDVMLNPPQTRSSAAPGRGAAPA